MATRQDDGITQDKPSEPAKKTIVIIGKTGVGKCTMVRNIFDADSAPVRLQISPPPQANSLDGSTRKASLDRYNSIHTLEGQPVQVIIMDTNGLDGNVNLMKVLQKIRDSAENLCAVFIVWMEGRMVANDAQPLNSIVESMAGLESITYLVITGCQGKNEEGKEQIKNMFIEARSTANICSFVTPEKMILVGFPDLNQFSDETIKAGHFRTIEQSKEVLKKIILEATPSQPITDLVWAIELPWYLRLQSWAQRPQSCIIL